MNQGLILLGQFVCSKRIDKETGVRYRCSITDGNDTYMVSVKTPPAFKLGEEVAVWVRATAFDGRVYLTADEVTAAKL